MVTESGVLFRKIYKVRVPWVVYLYMLPLPRYFLMFNVWLNLNETFHIGRRAIGSTMPALHLTIRKHFMRARQSFQMRFRGFFYEKSTIIVIIYKY